jgi:pyridoxal phosphate enzyme (YggS family)
MADLIMRWQQILGDLADLCAISPLCAAPPVLLAVSKTQPAAAIEPLLAAGHRHFGENRIQELMDKWPALREHYPDAVLHAIGPLQTNKVRETLEHCNALHTIDRLPLVDAILRERDKRGAGRCSQFFIQVNSGEEAQKGGVAPADLASLLYHCRSNGLPVSGLMCVPPLAAQPAVHFAFLRALAERHNLANLSMGMSGDYPHAIRFGATHIRIGTALFGGRVAL